MRSSRSQVFYKKNCSWKHLPRSLYCTAVSNFIWKETPAEVCYYEFYDFFSKQHFYRITPGWSLDLQKAQLYGLHLFCLPFCCYLYRCYFKKTDAQPNVKTKKPTCAICCIMDINLASSNFVPWTWMWAYNV